MRKIYLAVFIIFIASVVLFVASLFYLDKEKHKVYSFTVSLDGHDIGTIKFDKFVTDYTLVYKSQSILPFMPFLTESKSRITLDSNYGLQNYYKEESGNGATEAVYIENINNNISFVGVSKSEFARLTGLPIKHDTFVFEEYSPVTYLPILANYNFSMGKSQAFNVITDYSPLLPPMKRLLTLTSIRDEYMKVGRGKVKVECLLIRAKNLPQGMLWVTKSGRSLVSIEFPDKKLKMTRTFAPKTSSAERLSFKDAAYSEQEIKFNNKKITLSGTLSIPKKETLHPVVLLIGPSEESDREDQGLFTYISDALGKEDYVVLRYDMRGIGSSGGDSKSVTDADELGDAGAALDYLLGRKDVDPERLAIIGHGKGAFFAAKLASEKKNIKAIVLMSPAILLPGQTDLNFDNLNEMAAKYKWDEQYLSLAMKSRIETIEKVKGTKNKWASAMRIRCFLKKLRDELEENPTDIARKVEVPVLILHGKEDEHIPAKAAADLDKALEDGGNKNHKLIYYGYLGHFFGKLVNDGKHKMYYQADPDVLSTIKKWLDSNVSKIDLTL